MRLDSSLCYAMTLSLTHPICKSLYPLTPSSQSLPLLIWSPQATTNESGELILFLTIYLYLWKRFQISFWENVRNNLINQLLKK